MGVTAKSLVRDMSHAYVTRWPVHNGSDSAPAGVGTLACYKSGQDGLNAANDRHTLKSRNATARGGVSR